MAINCTVFGPTILDKRKQKANVFVFGDETENTAAVSMSVSSNRLNKPAFILR